MAEARAAGPLGPALALVVNAFVWGISWWPFRELQAQGLHPLWATAGVYLLSLAVLIAWQPRVLALCAGHPGLLVLALASGLTNIGFNWAVTEGDVVRVVLLFYLMPAWSVMLAWPLLGERPTLAGVLRLVLALTGVGVVLDTSAQGLPLPRSLPDFLALGAGLCFALTNILLRRLDRAAPATRILAMFAGGLVLAALTGGLGGMQGHIPAPAVGLAALPLALMLGLAFLGGNVALQFGASRLPAQATALIMLSEVVFASVSSVALGAADLSLRTAAGGALILTAAAWAAWPDRPARPDPDAQSPGPAGSARER